MRKLYTNPAHQAVADAAYRETLSRLLEISRLPGVTLSQAIDLTARGLDAEDVQRLSPEATMKRAERLQ